MTIDLSVSVTGKYTVQCLPEKASSNRASSAAVGKLPEVQQRLTLVSPCLQWSAQKRWHWTMTHFQTTPPKKEVPKCQEWEGMKKSFQLVDLKEGAMSYYSSPGSQSSHPCSLTQRVTHTHHQPALSTAKLPALTSPAQPPQPRAKQGDLQDALPGGGFHEERLIPSQACTVRFGSVSCFATEAFQAVSVWIAT